eukprot:CAMPEP_0180796810 /NCGR_PEP_ID=MMETSP1038_2-20121128/57009_1 /TAXON_ID=632150 /ORGANISM="Azadinium spinosum, Strain 3D9" /LENGTH=45 /DNA_ID= /DNA_START= /DNA_END= /DNA_ORIENTATION=
MELIFSSRVSGAEEVPALGVSTSSGRGVFLPEPESPVESLVLEEL